MARLPARLRDIRRPPQARQLRPRWLIGLAVAWVVLLVLDPAGLRYGYSAFEGRMGAIALTAVIAAGVAALAAAVLSPILRHRARFFGDDR